MKPYLALAALACLVLLPAASAHGHATAVTVGDRTGYIYTDSGVGETLENPDDPEAPTVAFYAESDNDGDASNNSPGNIPFWDAIELVTEPACGLASDPEPVCPFEGLDAEDSGHGAEDGPEMDAASWLAFMAGL